MDDKLKILIYERTFKNLTAIVRRKFKGSQADKICRGGLALALFAGRFEISGGFRRGA